MMPLLLDLLARPDDDGGRIPGVVTGRVTNNQDPEKLGRVKMCFPWLADTYESEWARVAVPMAGKERGMWMVPEVGDEVLVAFEQGDLLHPYVVGSLWSQDGAPPPDGAEAGSAVRMLRSRSGHVVRLDDREGKERIEITDGSGNGSIVIDTAKNAITLTCQGDMTLESRGGSVVIKAAKGMEVDSAASVRLNARDKVDITARAMEVGATGPVRLKTDGKVDITAGEAVKVTGSSIDLN